MGRGVERLCFGVRGRMENKFEVGKEGLGRK